VALTGELLSLAEEGRGEEEARTVDMRIPIELITSVEKQGQRRSQARDRRSRGEAVKPGAKAPASRGGHLREVG
jgi:hypothetical protein